jgi:hypothetical protein
MPSLKEEAVTWSNVSTSQTFTLQLGGRYSLDVVATFSTGNVDLQKLTQDHVTYVSVLPAVLTAKGSVLVDLPPGAYKLAITAPATSVFAALSRVQGAL